MLTTILLSVLGLTLIAAIVVEAIIIRGFLNSEKSEGGHRCLSGREIELIRRKLSTVGMQAIVIDDVFNLIKTIRDTHIGLYVDSDPYFPADPYGDINSKV